MAKKSSGGSHRSAVTGRFVTARYAKTHPATTVHHASKKGKK